MKITEDVRQYAEKMGLTEEAAIEAAMEEKSKEFADAGAEIYS